MGKIEATAAAATYYQRLASRARHQRLPSTPARATLVLVVVEYHKSEATIFEKRAVVLAHSKMVKLTVRQLSRQQQQPVRFRPWLWLAPPAPEAAAATAQSSLHSFIQ